MLNMERQFPVLGITLNLQVHFLRKTSPLCLNILVKKIYKKGLDTTLLIIYHERHVKAM